MASDYVFLPYVRLGLAACNTAVEDLQTNTAGNLDLSATVAIKDATSTTANLTLRSAGDVYGIASSQIVRTEPVTGATAFETNYFPFIEFKRADFPWLFTPAKANDGTGRLRPWVCLIAVPLDRTYVVQTSGPALITVQTGDLPDLGDSAYWAYVQVTGSFTNDDLSSILTNEPERVVSRLICPKRLEPLTSYRVCLVPAFKCGLQAGLGKAVSDRTSMEGAWSSDSSSALQLPVYYSWTFTTGEGGDFEALVRQLEAREMPPEVGVRALDASDAGLGLPAADSKALSYVGVLKAPESASVWRGKQASAFKSKLTKTLNLADSYTATAKKDPVIAPPIYGRWHAARDQVAATMNPQWLADLNLDPRVRVLAGMATEVIKAQQESLMASAWDQYDGIKDLNSALTKAQCAREISTSLQTRHIKVLLTDADNDVKTQLSSPAHSRALNDGQTVKATLRGTSLPKGTTTAAFRRATRAGGHAGRMMRLKTVSPSFTRLAVLKLFDGNSNVTAYLAADLPQPSGMYTTTDLGLGLSGKSSGSRSKSLPKGDLSPFDEDLRVTEAPAMDLSKITSSLTSAIDPASAIQSRMRLRCDPKGLNIYSRDDPLEVVLAAPNFPQAMYSYLRDIAGDWFVPGLENVPDDTVTLLVTNNPAIEAYMVGLSHEMGRELLWREFPTDQRGTCFKQFWDPASNYAASSSGTDTTDIGPIHLWGNTALGTNLHNADTDGLLVLLIRGELLRRYPDTIIYAQNMTNDKDRKDPLFQGSLGSDITFFGLPLNQTQALGYYIILQQHPTAPRFGLDETDDDLSWDKLDTSTGYLEVSKSDAGNASLQDLGWDGQNSADLASLTFQPPVRILIPVSDMLPAET
ncbi:MAG TPA: hypothetical protein VGI60_04945 [Chthoniobacterales bacterium]|jgi:hypothetical protein